VTSAEAAVDTVPKSPPALVGAAPPPPDTHVYQRVIRGGRVIDPETGFDAVADVGIDGELIAAIDRRPLQGIEIIDAKGKVVSPGFIDILSYEPEDTGALYKIGDGVTTNLGMHGINADADEFFSRFTDSCFVHFGGAFDNPWVRNTKFDLKPDDEASPDQITAMADEFERQLEQGWIGIDFEPEYAPGTTFEEMAALARVAQRYDVPCFFHGRYSAYGTNADTLDEIIRIASETGARVHVEHIISTGGTFDMANSLARLTRARDDGIDITACMYPYDFWATYLGSPRFAPGWQERFRITYSDLQVAGTSTRLTEASFESHRQANDLAAAFAIPEADVRTCLRSPLVMIGSDAILTDGNNHPRATGCFARTLGRYARDLGVIDLTAALAKITIMPAQRLERQAPGLRRKGRLQRGADADICVFDPEVIIDRSTIEQPAQYSAGIDHVLMLGQVVKTPERIDDTKRLGRPLTRQPT
jgi:dihydroorotase